jgi:hypothetical protein
MTETLLTDLSSYYEDPTLNGNEDDNDDDDDDQTNILDITNIPLVVVEPTVRRNSIVIPSVSNSSLSSAIQIETNDQNNATNNNNSLLPICNSNSLGKFFLKTNKIFIFFLQVISVRLHYFYWIIQYLIHQYHPLLINKMKQKQSQRQHLFNVDLFHQVVHPHHQNLQHLVILNRCVRH